MANQSNNPVAALGEATRLTELRNRFLFLIGGLIVYRIGTFIPVPGIDPDALAVTSSQSRDIAGVLSENGRVLGMMPHPERMIEAAHGGTDGRRMFEGLLAA